MSGCPVFKDGNVNVFSVYMLGTINPFTARAAFLFDFILCCFPKLGPFPEETRRRSCYDPES